VIDPVEEFFEINVNDAVARGNVLLRLSYCLMGGASRSGAVTVLWRAPRVICIRTAAKVLIPPSILIKMRKNCSAIDCFCKVVMLAFDLLI
jgi:hypothetical protein